MDKTALFKQIGYKPHPAQLLYHNSQARFRVACCGRRFGKSTMSGKDLEPELFEPKKRFWVVGPTYDLGEKEFRVIWDDLLVGQGLIRDKRVKRSYNKKQGDMYIEFPWQTRIEVRSADHPENLVGEALDRVIMSEAAKHKPETWQRFIRPALADKRGTADFPTTPEGYNWLHGVWALGQDPTYKDYESWTFPSWANSAVYPGGRQDPEILLLERTTSVEWFLQEIGAEFAAFVGKIFGEFTYADNVTTVPFRPDLPNYMAFDFGFTNPLAAVEFQITPMDEIRVWREHYRSYTTIPEHVQLMKGREQPEGYHLDLAFGDAADPEAAQMISQLLVPCIALPEAKENWRDGIDLMKQFLKLIQYGEDEYERPLERPRYFVDHSCVNHIKEMSNYRAPQGRMDRNAREAGEKQEDHTIDAMRYALVHIFKLGCTTHLSDVMTSSMLDTKALGDSDTGYFTTSREF
jgi:hypothetical protein